MGMVFLEIMLKRQSGIRKLETRGRINEPHSDLKQITEARFLKIWLFHSFSSGISQGSSGSKTRLFLLWHALTGLDWAVQFF
jgi:hypothetical protein